MYRRLPPVSSGWRYNLQRRLWKRIQAEIKGNGLVMKLRGKETGVLMGCEGKTLLLDAFSMAHAVDALTALEASRDRLF